MAEPDWEEVGKAIERGRISARKEEFEEHPLPPAYGLPFSIWTFALIIGASVFLFLLFHVFLLLTIDWGRPVG